MQLTTRVSTPEGIEFMSPLACLQLVVTTLIWPHQSGHKFGDTLTRNRRSPESRKQVALNVSEAYMPFEDCSGQVTQIRDGVIPHCVQLLKERFHKCAGSQFANGLHCIAAEPSHTSHNMKAHLLVGTATAVTSLDLSSSFSGTDTVIANILLHTQL